MIEPTKNQVEALQKAMLDVYVHPILGEADYARFLEIAKRFLAVRT
jgi:hypothetical protein